MNRRGFLSALAGAFVAPDPEKLLWTPGKKLISIPKPKVFRLMPYHPLPDWYNEIVMADLKDRMIFPSLLRNHRFDLSKSPILRNVHKLSARNPEVCLNACDHPPVCRVKMSHSTH